jgi:hypothetical protein
MPTPYDEKADLNLVAAYLTAQGLSAERFSDEEMQAGKTPDFRVRKGNAIAAYCEVKAPQESLCSASDQTQPLNDWHGFWKKLLRNLTPSTHIGLN